VAVLAGLSPTWYTYLEQSRDIRPSPEVLDSLARVLGLNEDERRYIHTLAYGQVIRPMPLETELSAEEMMREVVALTDHSPYPVYAANQYSDLIAWNRAAAEWYDDWSQYPEGERNIVRWMLTSPRAKVRLLNWESDTRDVVARWRGEAAKWPNDECLRQRVDELSRLSPVFAEWWADHDVREHRTRIRRFRHPRWGVQALRIVPMMSPEFMQSHVVFHRRVLAQ